MTSDLRVSIRKQWDVGLGGMVEYMATKDVYITMKLFDPKGINEILMSPNHLNGPLLTAEHSKINLKTEFRP